MALGKLWQVFFGKRSESVAPAEAVRANPTLPASLNAPRTTASNLPGPAASPSAAGLSVVAKTDAAAPRQSSGLGRAKRSTAKRTAKAEADPQLGLAIPPAAAVHDARPTRPKKNAWTPWLAGRSVLSILDTQPGDGTRAVELLEGIVCVSNPMPKYAAIDSFELAAGGLSVLKFHRMVRGAGGQAIPIPGGLLDGLRHLSQTHGTVDLILLAGAEADWERAEVRRWVERVAHPTTTILRRTAEGCWVAVERPNVVGTERRSCKAA